MSERRNMLRCQARELAAGMCQWPQCERPGLPDPTA